MGRTAARSRRCRDGRAKAETQQRPALNGAV